MRHSVSMSYIFQQLWREYLEYSAYVIQGRYIFKLIQNNDQIMGWSEM